MSTNHHNNREDLTGEHKWGDIGQIILLFIFLEIWVYDSFFLNLSEQFIGPVPYLFTIPVGALIAIYAFNLSRKGLKIVFGEIREEPHVIKKGVFSKVRHPIYFAAILLYIGFFVSTLSILSMGFFLIILTFYYFISRHEEKLLTLRFGKEYYKYKKSVPMLIPRTL